MHSHDEHICPQGQISKDYENKSTGAEKWHIKSGKSSILFCAQPFWGHPSRVGGRLRGVVSAWGTGSHLWVLATLMDELHPSDSCFPPLEHGAWESTCSLLLRDCFEGQIWQRMWIYFVNSMVNVLAQNEVPKYLEEGRCASHASTIDCQASALPPQGYYYVVQVPDIHYFSWGGHSACLPWGRARAGDSYVSDYGGDTLRRETSEEARATG